MITKFKIYEFWHHNDLPDYDLQELIPLELIYNEFDKEGITCNPKHNKSNDVEYYDDHIVCYATSFSLDGDFVYNINEKIKKISNNLYADSFNFDIINYILRVKFKFNDLEELSSKINAKKYNL